MGYAIMQLTNINLFTKHSKQVELIKINMWAIKFELGKPLL